MDELIQSQMSLDEQERLYFRQGLNESKNIFMLNYLFIYIFIICFKIFQFFIILLNYSKTKNRVTLWYNRKYS